jgi:flagellar export protein FliJ
MPFKFRLETLLRLKKLAETQALEQLGLSQVALQRCDQTITDLASEHEQTGQELASDDGVVLSGAEYSLVTKQLEFLTERLSQMQARRQELDADLEGQRANAQTRIAERKAHEQIRTRAQTRWRKECRRQERSVMDEIGAHQQALSPFEESDDE